MTPFSRRDFLKLGGLLAGAAYLPANPPEEWLPHLNRLGRAIRLIHVYDRPRLTANRVRAIESEGVFPIVATVLGDEPNYNPYWFRVADGFVYSGAVQPVQWRVQQPLIQLPRKGVLGEISVPYAVARTGPYQSWTTLYRLYYGTTIWLIGARSSEGEIWYQLFDERLQRDAWVRGQYVRLVQPEELTPLAPDLDKRIEIDLERQSLTCYQDGRRVMHTLCSTGPYLRMENGRRIFGTPAGDFNINRKRLTRHMAGDDLAAADFFDLPGVPWVSYFHWWGVSIHGTYWHNDYGKPHSHGCVNLPSETAKWVLRWTMPKAQWTLKETEGRGTPVVVF